MFKRARSSYVVSLILNQKKNLTLGYFIDALVQAINSSGGLRIIESIDEIPSAEDGIQVTAEDMELAYPKTRESPYANEWIHISDDSAIESVVLNDYDIIGFKHADDQDFGIEKPVYEEEMT
ncbi:hypothetical protein JCM33374_g5791 [Metschnikowia sp. JCM 33374]|nr:hypothetical protein JCM33374_g5791 [Metschnikowia sp. JCM 33374]